MPDRARGRAALDAGYNGTPVVRDCRPPRRAGRGRRAARPERRRQDHHALDDRRPAVTARRQRSRSTATSVGGRAAPPAGARAASRSSPRGAPCSSSLTDREHLRSPRPGAAAARGRADGDAPRARKCAAIGEAGLLSGGEQQMLAVGRALVSRPAAAARRRDEPRARARDRRAAAADPSPHRRRDWAPACCSSSSTSRSRSGGRRPRVRAEPRPDRARGQRRPSCAVGATCSPPAYMGEAASRPQPDARRRPGHHMKGNDD